MLRRLGLREGVVLNHYSKWQHQEARRVAQEYVREYYGSHPAARRLHYCLKEEGYLQYDGEVYTLKIYHYANGRIRLEIYDDRGVELLHQDGIRTGVSVVDVEVRTAFPFEHIYEPNEETYFHRSAGLC